MIENFPLALVLDVAMMVLLLITIIYAVRLTGYLKRFKNSRKELESVIANLSGHIEKAEKAVADLNEAVDISTYDLRDRIDRAAKMADELEMMTQTGDALANRLEELAVRNRKIIDGGEGDAADLMRQALKNEETYETRLEHVVKKVEKQEEVEVARPVFSIRDPEIERGETSFDEGFTLDDDDVLSEAERDLYNALRKKRGGN